MGAPVMLPLRDSGMGWALWPWEYWHAVWHQFGRQYVGYPAASVTLCYIAWFFVLLLGVYAGALVAFVWHHRSFWGGHAA